MLVFGSVVVIYWVIDGLVYCKWLFLIVVVNVVNILDLLV